MGQTRGRTNTVTFNKPALHAMQATPAIQQNTATKVKQMQNKNEYTEVKIMTYWEFFKKLIGDKFKTSYHAAR